MKFQKRILAILLLASTVFFASCEENSLIDPPSGTPMAPTNIMVSTRSATSIAVKWSRPSADTVSATGFDVIATPSGGTPITVSASGTDSIATVTGLTEGTVYTFTVRAKAGSNMSAASNGVMWAPAKRITVQARMYVSASSQGSGINLATGQNLTIANGGQWDLCLDDKDGRILVGSPGVSGYVTKTGAPLFPNGQEAKIVRMRDVTYSANSLNDIWETSSLGNVSNTTAFKEDLRDLGTISGTAGWGFVVGIFSQLNTTSPVNYAKVLVKRTGGTFIQGTGDNRYVDLEISYQSSQDTPYAISKIVDFGGARTTSNTIRKASN